MQATDVIMVPMRQDDVGDVWLLGIVVGALEQRLLEIRDVFLPSLASVQEDIWVALSDEVRVCTLGMSRQLYSLRYIRDNHTLKCKLARILTSFV